MIRANLSAGTSIDLSDVATNGSLVIGHRYMVIFASQQANTTAIRGLDTEQYVAGVGYNGYFANVFIGTANAQTLQNPASIVGTLRIINM